MARFFLEERGKNPNYFMRKSKKGGWIHFGQYGMDPLDTKYAQVYKPIYEQDKAVGHAVRATYMYTAMADLAGEDNDAKIISGLQAFMEQYCQPENVSDRWNWFYYRW